MTNFKINTERKRMSQDFDAEKITVTKAGVEMNVYEWIQESREDTEIYPTLEKYGCVEDAAKAMRLKTPELYADMREIKDLRSSIEQVNKANELWERLPLDVRKEFNHNSAEFVEKGEQWLKNKVDEMTAIEQPIINNPIQEVKTNG